MASKVYQGYPAAEAHHAGHRSLQSRRILHRDISINNIMGYVDLDATSSQTDHGFLIDLDFAVDIDRLQASGAPHRTGTLDFIAIAVLEGKSHSFRHDLESFLYVLIYMCFYFDFPQQPSEGRVRRPAIPPEQ